MQQAVALPEYRERVLIIGDGPSTPGQIWSFLVGEGFDADVISDAERGIEEAVKRPPSLIVLGAGMHGLSGIEALRRLKEREETRAVPVIFLTDDADESAIVSGLEIGADDYIAEAVSPGVLVARIRAVLRRSTWGPKVATTDVFSVGPIAVDFRRHEARVEGKLVPLTMAEFTLLGAFVREPGRAFSREFLLKAIGKHDRIRTERNVDVHVGTLRRKMGRHGYLIVTVRGIGYRFAG